MYKILINLIILIILYSAVQLLSRRGYYGAIPLFEPQWQDDRLFVLADIEPVILTTRSAITSTSASDSSSTLVKPAVAKSGGKITQ